jgi:hypothetical protein
MNKKKPGTFFRAFWVSQNLWLNLELPARVGAQTKKTIN